MRRNPKARLNKFLASNLDLKSLGVFQKFSLVTSSRATLSKFYVRLSKGYRLDTATAMNIDPS